MTDWGNWNERIKVKKMPTKNEIARLITETLFREELLNVADADSVEDLEKDVQNIIMDYLKNYIIISGRIVE